MRTDDVIRILLERLDAMGTERDVAASLGISASYLSLVLHRKRRPGPRILRALHLREVDREYVRADRRG